MADETTKIDPRSPQQRFDDALDVILKVSPEELRRRMAEDDDSDKRD